jgi:hypothetical protein
MNAQFTIPTDLLTQAGQLTNYCALEIAEQLSPCPAEKDIAAIEQVLKRFYTAMNATDLRQAA